MSDYHQEQRDPWERELSRVYAYLERHIPPDDQPLVRKAFGLPVLLTDPRQIEMAVIGDQE